MGLLALMKIENTSRKDYLTWNRGHQSEKKIVNHIPVTLLLPGYAADLRLRVQTDRFEGTAVRKYSDCKAAPKTQFECF